MKAQSSSFSCACGWYRQQLVLYAACYPLSLWVGIHGVYPQPAQVFYELHAERERQGKQSEVAIVRLEQLAPFPFDLVCRELYRSVSCVCCGLNLCSVFGLHCGCSEPGACSFA